MHVSRKDQLTPTTRKSYSAPKLHTHGGVEQLTHLNRHAAGASGLPGVGGGNGGGTQRGSLREGTHGSGYYTR